MRFIISIFLLSLCASCSYVAQNIGFGPPEREIERAYKNAEEMYNALLEGKLESSRQNWSIVILQFEEIVRDHPESQFADKAQYNLGLCYLWTHGLREESLQKAIEAFEYLIKRYPNSKLISNACYWKAYAYSVKGDCKRAIEEYGEIIARYPQSELYREALYQIDECRAKLGEGNISQPKTEPAEAQKPAETVEQPPVSVPAEVPPPPPAAPTERKEPAPGQDRYSYVKDIRFHSGREFTRVVIDLSKPVKHESKKLENPPRIYIDLKSAIIAPAKKTMAINDGLVKGIRAAQFDKDTVRVVIDINEIKRYRIFHLNKPDRLVIDIYNSDAAPQTLTLVKQLGLKVETIVIDPGHGGKDPGTIAGSGLQEKQVVLDIAKRLERLLESDGFSSVCLTREDDTFIPLEDRTEFANKKGADVFVSIHANSCKNRSTRGIETYYLALASDEDARLTAALENASARRTIKDLGSLVFKVLRSTKADESRELAGIVQSRLCRYTEANDRGVRHAPFIVLIGANAPSVLVELGFMSNDWDEQLLNSEEYKDKLARALMEAVKDYVKTMDQAGLASRGARP